MPRRFWKLADGRVGTVVSATSGNIAPDVFFVCAADLGSLKNSITYIRLSPYLTEKDVRAGVFEVFSRFRVFLLGSGNEETLMGRDYFMFLMHTLKAHEIPETELT